MSREPRRIKELVTALIIAVIGGILAIVILAGFEYYTDVQLTDAFGREVGRFMAAILQGMYESFRSWLHSEFWFQQTYP